MTATVTRYTYGLRSNGQGRFYVMSFTVRNGRKIPGGKVISNGALDKDAAEAILAALILNPEDAE